MSLESLPKVENPTMPILWVDAMEASLRTDGACTMRMYAFLPRQAIEVARCQLTADTLRSFSDLLARMTDYFPTRESVLAHTALVPKPKD